MNKVKYQKGMSSDCIECVNSVCESSSSYWIKESFIYITKALVRNLPMTVFSTDGKKPPTTIKWKQISHYRNYQMLGLSWLSRPIILIHHLRQMWSPETKTQKLKLPLCILWPLMCLYDTGAIIWKIFIVLYIWGFFRKGDYGECPAITSKLDSWFSVMGHVMTYKQPIGI